MRTLITFLCVGLFGLSASATPERMLGLRRLPKGRLDFAPAPDLRSYSQETVDWRPYSTVMNQGNCGSCVAFATIATLQIQMSIAAGVSWLNPHYSTDALFACGGGSCDGGWMPEEAVSYLQSSGVPDEACLPNTSASSSFDAQCSDMCSDSSSRIYKILSYTTPTSGGGDVETVKAALRKGPLVTTLSVYDDFLLYEKGVYQHKTGNILGGHAVSLVGFDDTKRAWLVQNSWGPDWGEGGYIWISWDDDSGIGGETWGLELEHPANFISVTYPNDLDYVSGQIKLTSQGNVKFHLRDSKGQEIGVYTADSIYAFDTTKLREGRFEIYAESLSAPGVKSQVREFYILNSEPQMSLSFSPVKKIKPNGSVNGRIEFDIKAIFSPVPIQHLQLRILDPQGKVVKTLSNDRVLSAMRMGWRTPTVPNGHYNLVLHGETNYNGKVYSVDSSALGVTVKN